MSEMMSPNKKTVTSNFDELLSRSVIHYGVGHGMSAGPKPPAAPKPEAPKPPGAGDLPPKVGRLVSVEEAAVYAGVGRTKMYELIDVGAVRSGHRPGSNRRWVDLDSIDDLYRSPERLRWAEEMIRNLRQKRIAAKNEREDGSG